MAGRFRAEGHAFVSVRLAADERRVFFFVLAFETLENNNKTHDVLALSSVLCVYIHTYILFLFSFHTTQVR